MAINIKTRRLTEDNPQYKKKMKLIKASYQVMSDIAPDTIMRNIELAGRACYKSEDKITSDSSSKFVRMIISRGHESVLEHEKITVRFVCDRGVSHELVRHKLLCVA